MDAAQIERAREAHRQWLRGPESYLAAVARHELPVGSALTIHGHHIEAAPDGFVVDGGQSGPRTIDAGRYRLRLSHQNAPAVIVLDRDSPHFATPVDPRWFPYGGAYRFVVPLEPDATPRAIRSTREQDRRALRVGSLSFGIDGVACRLEATRLLEPGVGEGDLEVYFRDATTGNETYQVGRYVGVEHADDGRYVLDFNRAYNPACAYSPFYNCPIPPAENRLTVAIRAGEMTPHA